MKTYKLKNGTPVVLANMEGTNVVTALILFKVGSRNEAAKTNGISHFLEHLFFKGTENRPTTLDISKELDGVGADFNAFTGKEYTGYYVKVAKENTNLALDVLEDLLFNPLFDAEEIERERGVIIEEINMYKDNPMVTAEEEVEMLMYGEKHPLGYKIAGPEENILSVSRNTILKYRETYYHPGNMVVVLAGSLPSNVKKRVEMHFDGKDRKKKATPKYKPFKASQKRARINVINKDTAQAHLALSFPGPTHTSKDAPVARVVSAILGGSMSSRLFINVRERQGLCYYIRSGISAHENQGVLTIQAGFDTKRIDKAIKGIVEELRKFREEGITEEELQMAKDYIRGKSSIRLEDSENIATYWAQQYLFGGKTLESPEDKLKHLDTVTLDQANKYIKKTFVKDMANLVIIGPYTKRKEKKFLSYIDFK